MTDIPVPKPKPKISWWNIWYMDNNFKKVGVMILFMSPFFIVIEYIDTYNHEMVHKQIAIYNGCNRTEVKITALNGGYFKCLEYDNITDKNDNLEYLLDSQNEIINYNNHTIIITMIFCTFAICLAMLLTAEVRQ